MIDLIDDLLWKLDPYLPDHYLPEITLGISALAVIISVIAIILSVT